LTTGGGQQLLTTPDRPHGKSWCSRLPHPSCKSGTQRLSFRYERFASNWELSTARAVEVVKLLIAQGVNARALSAAGYGEFDPVAGNDTIEGRARNRRIEITLQPNLDELVSAPAVN
jgi:hypothetical protein